MADDSSGDAADNSGKNQGLLGETLRKVFTAGVSAAFMTEESVRAYLAELKLPKEVLGLLLQQANKSKEEITNRVSKEVVSMVQKIDFVKEFSKFAETHTFKVTAEIEVKKKDQKQ
jgi:hypothetical protein